MRIDILTLFPSMFDGPFSESMLKRIQEKGLVEIKLHNFRNFAEDKHKTVDDTPYGGGVGMVLRVDVLVKALETITGRALPSTRDNERIFLLSAKGQTFSHQQATELAKLDRLVLICGHYEGPDERLLHFIDGELSIGNFILTGGEIPAMAVVDAIARLLPGALTEGSAEDESFSEEGIIEYPHYTKPQTFRGLAVPQVLLSGNHATIAAWRSNKKRKQKV